jgi:hypothetical protein
MTTDKQKYKYTMVWKGIYVETHPLHVHTKDVLRDTGWKFLGQYGTFVCSGS